MQKILDEALCREENAYQKRQLQKIVDEAKCRATKSIRNRRYVRMLSSLANGGMVCLVFFFFCNQIKFDLLASAGHPPADRIKRERVRITMQAGDIACTLSACGRETTVTDDALPDRNRKAALHRVGTQCSSTCPWSEVGNQIDP